AEDLVEQDRLDRDVRFALTVRFYVALVPGKPKTGEPGHRCTGRGLVAPLDGEHVEAKIWLEAGQRQRERVIECAACDGRLGRRVWRAGLGAVNERLVGEQREGLAVHFGFGRKRARGKWRRDECSGGDGDRGRSNQPATGSTMFV